MIVQPQFAARYVVREAMAILYLFDLFVASRTELRIQIPGTDEHSQQATKDRPNTEAIARPRNRISWVR